MASLARGLRFQAYLLAALGRCLPGCRPGIAPTSVQAEWGMLSRATQRPTSSRLGIRNIRDHRSEGRTLDDTGPESGKRHTRTHAHTRTPQTRHRRTIESPRLNWFGLGVQNTYRHTAVACPRTEQFVSGLGLPRSRRFRMAPRACGKKTWHVSVVRRCGEAGQGCLISRQICRVCREAVSATQQSVCQRGDSISRLLGRLLHLISCTRAVPA